MVNPAKNSFTISRQDGIFVVIKLNRPSEILLNLIKNIDFFNAILGRQQQFQKVYSMPLNS